MIDPEKMRLFMQALKPDLPGLARQVFIENPQTAMRELPGKLQASRDLLNQYEPGKGIDPRLMDQFMNLTGSFAPMGVTAYHGSPYLFRMFDPMKRGTGEGAQAYGVGAGYTAEVRDIGESYRDVLASPRNQAMSGRGVYIEPSPMGDKTWRIAQPDQVLGGKATGRTGDATQGLTDYEFKNVASAIKYAKKKGWINKNQKINLTEVAEEGKYNPVRSASQMEDPLYNQLIASEQGYLYKGDIPDEIIPKFLDWDKPIKEQSDEVQKLAKQYKLDPDDLGGDLVARVGKTVEGSQIMEAAGIKGIKYLDANSRNAQYGSQNLIPFRPQDYDIKEINDIPIEEWIRRGLL